MTAADYAYDLPTLSAMPPDRRRRGRADVGVRSARGFVDRWPATSIAEVDSSPRPAKRQRNFAEVDSRPRLSPRKRTQSFRGRAKARSPEFITTIVSPGSRPAAAPRKTCQPYRRACSSAYPANDSLMLARLSSIVATVRFECRSKTVVRTHTLSVRRLALSATTSRSRS